MLKDKALKGIQKAPPEKRYKSFLNTVTDLEQVWFLNSEDGYVTYEINGTVYLLIWPRKEFCSCFIEADELPEAMDIHEFLLNCHGPDAPTHFMVFPTSIDCYIVTTEELCADIENYLSEVE